ncbi:MAG TPA: response regulator [Rhodocyclaceae bacterium]|nr:response regulator [Rhodocyclaceae bacterium]
MLSAQSSAIESTSPPTILVVEDDDSIAMLLRFILEREGYLVVYAAEGRQAQNLIATMAPPNLVLLDIMLPYIGGFDLLDFIRSRDAWKDSPVLMLTAKGTERDIARALDAGADDYIVKPFQPDEMKARIRRLLRRTQ